MAITKAAFRAAARKHRHAWVNNLRNRDLPKELYSIREIHALFNAEHLCPTTIHQMSLDMRDCGFLQVRGGFQVLVDGRLTAYYILRNEDKWLNASYKDVQQYATEHLTGD